MTDPIFFESLRELAKQQKSPVAPPGQPGSIKKQEGFFRRSITISLIGHGAFLFFFFVGPMIASLLGVSLDYSDRFEKKDLKNAIRVDLVGLPNLTLEQMQDMDPTLDVGATPPEETKADEEAKAAASETAKKIILEEAKKAEQKAKADAASVAKKKADEAQKKRLADLRASMRVEQRRKELANELKQGGREELAGNIVSQGYSITGDVAEDADIFRGHLQAHIRKVWSVPGWMNASNLSARVLMKIGPTGKLLSVGFIKKSGNEEFDRYVAQAARDAEPYPPPPSTLQRQLMEQGLEWGFPQ